MLSMHSGLMVDMVIQMTTIKTYSELIQFPTFEERYRYLRLCGKVGEETFGFDRYLNQNFYRRDNEWLELRDYIIRRDNGCDLGIPDRSIGGRILIHHIEPITKDDVLRRTKRLLDPDNLICVMDSTHRAIHYGDESLLILAPVERTKNDTCPWRH